MVNGILIILLAFLVVLFIFMMVSIKVVPQKESWVVERFGKFHRTVGAGLRFIFPILDTVRARVSLKEKIMDIPKQEVITEDNVMIEVDAICYYSIIEPRRAIYNIENLEDAIRQTLQALLRDIVGKLQLDDIISSRGIINKEMEKSLLDIAKDWGIKIHRVEVKEIMPPPNILESMSKLIEAEKSKDASITEAEGKRKAMIIEAEGKKLASFQEAEALERLAQAQTNAIKLLTSQINDAKLAGFIFVADSYINALREISGSKNSKVVILPPNIDSLIDLLGRKGNNDIGNS